MVTAKSYGKICLSLLPFLLFSTYRLAFSQSTDTTFTALFSLPLESNLFSTDKLNQVYLVSTNNEVIKYTADAKEQFRYNNNRLGPLEFIDATDPFNLLLFYPQFQTVIQLDRTLSPTGELTFLELEIINASALATSRDNNLWVYDNVTHRLYMINAGGQTLRQSNPLTLELDAIPNPIYMQAHEDWVYASDPNLGILVFDIFGQYQKLLPIKGINRFQIWNQQLVFYKDDQLQSFDLKTLTFKTFPLPKLDQQARIIRIQTNRLFVLEKNGLKAYSF